MADSIQNLFQFHQSALNLRAFRQQLLASNIANADTPGYKARDVDFSALLREATSGGAAVLAASHPRHAGAASAQAGAAPAGSAVLYRSVSQPSIDGNTVDMDGERNRFAQNAIHYEANIAFINSQIRLMLAALQG